MNENPTPTLEQMLEQAGEQLTATLARAMMKGQLAGAIKAEAALDRIAAKAEREADAQRDEMATDGLMVLAARLDERREHLRRELADASGLKAAALKRELARLDRAEDEMVARLEQGEAPATSALPPADHDGSDTVTVKTHQRKKPAKNA